MDKLEEIKENLELAGFKKEDENTFVYENVSYSTININGKITRKENKKTLKLEYTGTGGEVDDSDNCLDDIYFFDIFEDGKNVMTVGVRDFEELAEIFGINEKNKV